MKLKGQSLGLSESDAWDEGSLSSFFSSDDAHLEKDD